LIGVAAIAAGAFHSLALVTVPTPCQAIEKLIQQIDSSALSHGRKTDLSASLQAACASFEHNNPTAAANQLRAFQRKVRAQLAPTDPTTAAAIIQAAQDIIEAALP
jgi:hypothetical protein